MAKIIKLEQKTFEGKPKGFTVTFDDGRSGNMMEKESDKGLRVNDEVFVTEVPYTSKAGKTSTLYEVHLSNGGQAPTQSQSNFNPQGGLPPMPPQRPQINVGAGKSIEECKVMCAIAVFEAVYSKMKEESDPVETLSINFKKIAPLLYSEVDAIFARK